MSATKGLFNKYLSDVFIETGSNFGDGIQQALDEGFTEVYSCDIDNKRYDLCRRRFRLNLKVHLILDDSVNFLIRILPLIDKRATFWLDAHKGNGKSPLISELAVISQHQIKDHILLIDDLRDWKKEICGFNTEILKNQIIKINENYKFYLEDGYVPEDILAARV